jgi:excisionase family DNA binding protein
MDEVFERWARAYNVAPLNSVKRTCELLGCGHDHFYKLVKQKKLIILKDGTKSNITGENIYALVRSLPSARDIS